ncbi:MAG: methyltransferase domain-containing protein [Chloroflexi bacterium]|nr:methyltransferase domain-containing protein [Chloroflexota bacterium]
MGGQTGSVTRPARLFEFYEGVASASAFVAGMKLGVFSALREGPRAAEQIALDIEADPQKLRILLYVLASAGLLKVSEGRFSNSPEAQRFYVDTSPDFVGPVHEQLPPRWMEDLRTAESVLSGTPCASLDWGSSSEAVGVALRRMFPGARATGQALAREFDFSGIKSLVDIAGGAGGVAVALAESCPEVQGTVIDLPGAAKIAREQIAKAGLSHRLDVLERDILAEPVPGQYDAAVARYFFQVLGRDDVPRAMKNVASCLKPGAALFILGDVLRNNRTSPRSAALVFGLSAINRLNRGQAYTESEYRTWLRESGFTDCGVTFKFMPDGPALLVACKEPILSATSEVSRTGGSRV